MKKFAVLALVLVLTVSVLAGCRRGDGDVSTSPMASEEMTLPIVPPTVIMPTESTRPTDATEQPGNDTTPRGMLN